MVLIFSNKEDLHISKVCDILNQAAKSFYVFDISKFPINSSISLMYEENLSSFSYSEQNIVDLVECSAVWWRRPQRINLHKEIMFQNDRQFISDECTHLLQGLWSTLNCKWINDPVKNEVAAKKVFQLQTAKSLGFSIPVTLITNNIEDARNFITQYGCENIIYKPLAPRPVGAEWRETRVIRENELDMLECVKYSPVIFQQYIKAVYDLRITVVNKRIFPAVIFSGKSDYPFDVRMGQEYKIEPYKLPQKIVSLIHSLMKKLDLIYGAIDMRVTPEGKYVFLEINPGGQWLFVESATKMPIAESIAIELMSV